jgi:tetratricopeptide (TPR) repeat protein
MSRFLRSFAMSSTFILIATLAPAENVKSWVGESVVYKKHPSEIKFGDTSNGKQINLELSGRLPIRVVEERDGKLRILDNNLEGWVDRDEFMLVRDAPPYFERLIKANPKDVWPLIMRGIMWSQKGNLDSAIKDFTDCIRLDPKYADVYLNRGCAWEKKSEYDLAIKDYDDLIHLRPKYSLAFFNRGNAWCKKNDYAKAIADYDEAMRLDPKDPSALDNQAYLLATCPDNKYRNIPKAKELMKTVVKLRPQSPYTEDTLSVIAAAEGRFEDAIKHLKKALEDKGYTEWKGAKARDLLKAYEEKRP